MEKVATGVYLLKPAPARVHRFDDYESPGPTHGRHCRHGVDPSRSQHRFKTVKRNGYDPAEVDAFKTTVASSIESAQNQATAMEARARAAVAKLQELPERPVHADAPRRRRRAMPVAATAVELAVDRGRDDQPHAAARPAHRRHHHRRR